MERYKIETVFGPESRPSDMLRMMQDAAGEDAIRRDAGMDKLIPHNCTWVIIKMRLDIRAMPKPGQKLWLESWPTTARLGMYPRYYELRDQAGELMVSAKGIWAIMDMASRSLVMGDSFGFSVAEEEEERFRPVRNLLLPEGGESFELTAGAEHIDTNGHVNNAAYLDLAELCRPAELKNEALRGIAIDFVHEIMPGESFNIRVLREDGCCHFEGSREDRVLFRLSESFAV